jgi:chromosome condensin MukBEF MukE localization factor
VPDVQIDHQKLIEAARAALHDLEISQEVISRLQDTIDSEWQSVHSAHSRLRAILKRAGADVDADDFDVENAATRLVRDA